MALSARSLASAALLLLHAARSARLAPPASSAGLALAVDERGDELPVVAWGIPDLPAAGRLVRVAECFHDYDESVVSFPTTTRTGDVHTIEDLAECFRGQISSNSSQRTRQDALRIPRMCDEWPEEGATGRQLEDEATHDGVLRAIEASLASMGASTSSVRPGHSSAFYQLGATTLIGFTLSDEVRVLRAYAHDSHLFCETGNVTFDERARARPRCPASAAFTPEAYARGRFAFYERHCNSTDTAPDFFNIGFDFNAGPVGGCWHASRADAERFQEAFLEFVRASGTTCDMGLAYNEILAYYEPRHVTSIFYAPVWDPGRTSTNATRDNQLLTTYAALLQRVVAETTGVRVPVVALERTTAPARPFAAEYNEPAASSALQLYGLVADGTSPYTRAARNCGLLVADGNATLRAVCEAGEAAVRQRRWLEFAEAAPSEMAEYVANVYGQPAGGEVAAAAARLIPTLRFFWEHVPGRHSISVAWSCAECPTRRDGALFAPLDEVQLSPILLPPNATAMCAETAALRDPAGDGLAQRECLSDLTELASPERLAFPGFFVHREGAHRAPVPDHTFVEVMRVGRIDDKSIENERNLIGQMWFWRAEGSGIWYDVGRSYVLTADSAAWPSCREAFAQGFDSIQLLSSFRGYSSEIIDCRGAGTFEGQHVSWHDACPPAHVAAALRCGLPAPRVASPVLAGLASAASSAPCACHRSSQWLNCAASSCRGSVGVP